MSRVLLHRCDMSNLAHHTSPLRDARERRGLTREQLAVRAEISTSTIARIELNDHLPGAAALARLADVLGVSVHDLLPERVAS